VVTTLCRFQPGVAGMHSTDCRCSKFSVLVVGATSTGDFLLLRIVTAANEGQHTRNQPVFNSLKYAALQMKYSS